MISLTKSNQRPEVGDMVKVNVTNYRHETKTINIYVIQSSPRGFSGYDKLREIASFRTDAEVLGETIEWEDLDAA